MKLRLVSIATFATLLLAGTAYAQGNPGAHFIENWDQDGDGVVTLEEIKEKRGEVFYMFDQEDDGFLSAKDYELFDETRAADMAMEMEQQGQQGNGHGNGGNANGGGGKNSGQGQGNQHRGAEGMSLEFNDADGDGQVSLAEFIDGADAWFVTMDRDGDGVLSGADFGRP